MAIIDFYRDPLVIKWYIDPVTKQKITVPRYNEQYKIVKNTVTLAEIPSEQQKINTITIGVTTLYESSYNNIIDENHFVVNYTLGLITFSDIYDGQTAFIPRYDSRGVIFYPGSRIYSQLDENGNVIETIDELIKNNTNSLNLLIENKTNSLNLLIENKTNSLNLLIENKTNELTNAINTLYNSFNNLGEYENNITYIPHNIVSYYGSSYMCIANTVGNNPTNVNYWKILAVKGSPGVGLNYKGEYNSFFEYDINDLVTYQGSVYHCIQTSIGNLPTNTSYWQLFVRGTIISTLRNTYTITGVSTNTVPIGISGFNKDNDVLMVYVNSTYIEVINDYTISSDSLNIIKVSGDWNGGGATIFNFVVFKNINSSYYADGNFILDGSIPKQKLTTSFQNEISNKSTIVVSSTPPEASVFWIDNSI